MSEVDHYLVQRRRATLAKFGIVVVILGGAAAWWLLREPPGMDLVERFPSDVEAVMAVDVQALLDRDEAKDWAETAVVRRALKKFHEQGLDLLTVDTVAAAGRYKKHREPEVLYLIRGDFDAADVAKGLTADVEDPAEDIGGFSFVAVGSDMWVGPIDDHVLAFGSRTLIEETIAAESSAADNEVLSELVDDISPSALGWTVGIRLGNARPQFYEALWTGEFTWVKTAQLNYQWRFKDARTAERASQAAQYANVQGMSDMVRLLGAFHIEKVRFDGDRVMVDTEWKSGARINFLDL